MTKSIKVEDRSHSEDGSVSVSLFLDLARVRNSRRKEVMGEIIAEQWFGRIRRISFKKLERGNVK
jgi:hypothetical protein